MATARTEPGSPPCAAANLSATCSEPLSVVFLVRVEGFTLLSPSTRERSVPNSGLTQRWSG